MKTLLSLQKIDLEIEACKAREVEIPKQKGKFDIHKKRLALELEERTKLSKNLLLEQRENESEIEQKQAQIAKYDGQLAGIKKNTEYQALLHEMDGLKKQISLKEERVISIMMELDEMNARLVEDKTRIDKELADIARQCAEIDLEFGSVVEERKCFEQKRAPLAKEVDVKLLTRYTRVKNSNKTGPAVVPLNGQSCSGCFMSVTPQIINEVMAGERIHSCSHCGRLLYFKDNFNDS